MESVRTCSSPSPPGLVWDGQQRKQASTAGVPPTHRELRPLRRQGASAPCADTGWDFRVARLLPAAWVLGRLRLRVPKQRPRAEGQVAFKECWS